MFWQPRSIRQLVLIGLVAVLAPLCVAIFYTVQAVDELSRRNDQVIGGVVSITRITQVFQSDVLELERRARQYLALSDASLLDLFIRERQRLQEQLAEIGQILREARTPDPQLILVQRKLSAVLQELPEDASSMAENLDLFDELASINREFQQLSQRYVDNQVEESRQHASEIRASLLWLVGSTALFTAVVSLLYVYWVNKPIKQLESQIALLGAGDVESTIEIRGPREMRTLGRQLDWMRRQFNELEEQKKQFLMHMSHELKTPLASLREGLDLLVEGVAGDLDEKQREIIDILQENSRDLQRLIENLLDYNQVLHSRNLQIDKIDLRGLWRDILLANQMIIKNKELRVASENIPEFWYSDVAMMRTVLDNLLSNAVNYSPAGEEIGVRCEQDNDLLMFEVANNGNPVPEDERRRIFQPFYQGKSVRSGPIKGSGIGLSVARECAQALGGSLELVAHEEFAVCFRFQCPRGSVVSE